MNTSIHPVYDTDRIQSLDILRGFAILGILIMNIQSFSMPTAAYINPTAYGDLTGMNLWVWILSHVFADQKFISIFSVLYGAGIILVTQSAEKKTGKSAGLHYRRTFWLLIIGLIHGHLIWYGDILVQYALCAFIVFPFRKARPKRLFIAGLIIISMHTVIYVFFGWSIQYWPQEQVNANMQSWRPTADFIHKSIASITGSLSDQVSYNSQQAIIMETIVFFLQYVWRAGGLMLVGMACYKWGILTAERTSKFYKRGWLISWVIGLPVIFFGIIRNFQEGWSFEFSMFMGSQYNYLGSLSLAFGYICMIMLLAKSSLFITIKNRLASVGQMALTNYISQSVIAVIIFYGVGFGLYGQVDRVGQILITFAIWLLQILWSKPWLTRYRYGPLEWVWRSLTYMKRQAMRKSL